MLENKNKLEKLSYLSSKAAEMMFTGSPGTADGPAAQGGSGRRALKMRNNHQGLCDDYYMGSWRRTRCGWCTSRSALGEVRVSQEGQETKKIILNCLPFRMKNNEPFLGQTVTMWQKNRLLQWFSSWTEECQSISQGQTCTK